MNGFKADKPIDDVAHSLRAAGDVSESVDASPTKDDMPKGRVRRAGRCAGLLQ
jgi:hypothetical protein